MKMKSLAILALSGVLAASVAYIAPAIADDTSGHSMQNPSDNNMQNSGSTDNTMNNASDPSNIGSPDQGSPDTATGDDDY